MNNYLKSDLVFQFAVIDALQIQQMLLALNSGYDFRRIVENNGVVEFVLKKGNKQ